MAGRKKLNRGNLHARVAPDTPDKLKEIAYKLGYTHANQGSTGKLLDAIASSKIILLPDTIHTKMVNVYSILGNNKTGE